MRILTQVKLNTLYIVSIILKNRYDEVYSRSGNFVDKNNIIESPAVDFGN